MTVEVLDTDITKLEVDAISNAANTQLEHGGAVAGAISRAGGPTSAQIIRDATASTLRKADELGARSVALVAFGTGVGGFSVEEAARIEVDEVRRHLAAASRIERVVFAVRGDTARRAFEAVLAG